MGPRSLPESTLHWRRTRQLRQLKRTSDTVLYTLGALVPIPVEASLPPLLLVILAAGRAGPTRNCCAGPSGLAEFTTENEFIAITAKRPRSSEPPIPNDAGGGGGWQRADEGAHLCHRCGEPASRSSLRLQLPSPLEDCTVRAFLRGVRRVKHAVRGPVRRMFRSDSFA